jgi:hypothetical protein
VAGDAEAAPAPTAKKAKKDDTVRDTIHSPGPASGPNPVPLTPPPTAPLEPIWPSVPIGHRIGVCANRRRGGAQGATTRRENSVRGGRGHKGADGQGCRPCCPLRHPRCCIGQGRQYRHQHRKHYQHLSP